MESYAHILFPAEIDEVTVDYQIDEDIGYNPEYVWDVDFNDGLSFFDEDQNSFDAGYTTTNFVRSFF